MSQCERCGSPEARRRYCPTCASAVYYERRREAVRRWAARQQKPTPEARSCRGCGASPLPGSRRIFCDACNTSKRRARRKRWKRSARAHRAARPPRPKRPRGPGGPTRNGFFRKRSRKMYVSAQDLARLWKSQRGRCALTGRKLDRSANVDHIVPRSRGGPETLDNLRWLTPAANQAKGSLTDVEFVSLCSDVLNFLKLV